MKLNKILALALSGVMAVSMLAGCSTNGKDDEEVIVTPSTGAAAILNDKQDKVEFTNVTSSELEKAVSGLAAKDLATNASATILSSGNAVYDRLTALGVKDQNNAWYVFNTNTDDSKTKVVNIVYGATGALNMDEVVKQIAKGIDTINTSYVKGTSTNAKLYSYSYTGTVSTVTATSIDGAQSAQYVLVSVTQTVTESDTNQGA